MNIAVSVTDATAVNTNGIKTLLTNSWTTFFIKSKLVFGNGPRSLPKKNSWLPYFIQLSF